MQPFKLQPFLPLLPKTTGVLFIIFSNFFNANSASAIYATLRRFFFHQISNNNDAKDIFAIITRENDPE